MTEKTRLALMTETRKPARAAHDRYMTSASFAGRRAAATDVAAWGRRLAALASR